MKKSILLGLIGLIISFLFLLMTGEKSLIGLYFYYSTAIGVGWGLAHYLDSNRWTLPQKLSISLISMTILLFLGVLFFDFKTALPSVIRFSTIFVAYYLIASFRNSKSLRQ